MDYPNIRKSLNCPLCTQAKDPGLIICWACYREHDARTGLDYLIVETLEKKETYLARAALVNSACTCGHRHYGDVCEDCLCNLWQQPTLAEAQAEADRAATERAREHRDMDGRLVLAPDRCAACARAQKRDHDMDAACPVHAGVRPNFGSQS